MTGTNCDLFTHNQSRSYLNHLVFLFPVQPANVSIISHFFPLLGCRSRNATVALSLKMVCFRNEQKKICLQLILCFNISELR
jgi:hypothetical protein